MKLRNIQLSQNINERNRKAWLKDKLTSLPRGTRILDAGAGELQYRQYCTHLEYISQDFCQYVGKKKWTPDDGLQCSNWDTSLIDIVSDISNIPVPDASFDAILCSEVLEHIPEPTHALDEFARILKPGGKLFLTAPFSSLVHMAPYHYCSGFSRYWYEHHLPLRGFKITELSPNEDWYAYLRQEITRLGGMERRLGNWTWPLAYVFSLLGVLYFKLRRNIRAEELACFGWHCVSEKSRQFSKNNDMEQQ